MRLSLAFLNSRGWGAVRGTTTRAVMTEVDVCVIGGGISGLTALRRLRDAGVKAVVLEKASRLGGIWAGKGTYECLQLQQHKRDFSLGDWPSGVPDYPSAEDVRLRLQAYIDDHGLLPYCKTLSEVTSVSFQDDRWLTQSNHGAITSKYVAFASGSLGAPRIPASLATALKDFGGSMTHSADYYRPIGYGPNVVVVGWGASSVEIAADLAMRGNCKSVTLIAPPKKNSYEDWCLSRALGDDVTRYYCANPEEVTMSLTERNAVIEEAMEKRHPNALKNLPPALRPNGLRPLDGRIIISEAFHDALDKGLLRVVAANVLGSQADGLLLDVVDSEKMVLPADDLVLCTGYDPPLPRLTKLMDPAPTKADFYMTMFAPEAPNAAFLGLGFGFISVPKLADVQARILTDVVTDRIALPSPDAMRSWIHDVATANVMATTQCLTDNRYFAQIVNFSGAEKVPPPPALAAQETTRGSISSLAYTTPKQQQYARAFSTVARSDDEVRLSPIGEEITNSRFESSNPCAAYAKWAETYDDDSFEVLKFDSPMICADYVVAYWPPQCEEVAMLDVGCGTGAVGRFVKHRLGPARVAFHGIDLTRQMLDVAERRGDYTSLTEWSVSETPWPFQDNSMDIAACNGVLLYVEPQLRVLTEFIRVVKPEGSIVLMIRDDNIHLWQPIMDELEHRRMWRLVEVSESRDNFPGQASLGDGPEDPPITYRIYVLRVLPSSSSSLLN